jgi:hypothetical protein
MAATVALAGPQNLPMSAADFVFRPIARKHSRDTY